MTYPTATLEEVWALFKETDREITRLSQEADRRSQETGREITRLSQEADRRSQETDRMMRELSKKMEETRTEIGKLGNRLGEFVEGFIKPSVVKLFQQRGIDVHKVLRDIEANNRHLGLATQIDLLVVNQDVCIIIEVKSRLSVDDVNEHIERMEKFKPLFSEYRDKQVLGAVAGMVIADDVAKYAYRKGFFVIGQRGENAVILNDEKFKPTAW